MPNLISRARAYAPLAPWERALLRLAESIAIAGLVATLPILITQVQSGHVDWMAVWPVFVVAALTALLKLFTASNDPPLPAGTSASLPPSATTGPAAGLPATASTSTGTAPPTPTPPPGG